jgi:hypothetical protein
VTLTLTLHEEGQRRHHDGRRRIAVAAVVDLGGIELARSRRVLAHHLVIRHRIERDGGCHSIAFALAAGGRLGAAKPPKAEAQHDGGGNDAEAGRGQRRRAEERHRDGILDRRRSRQPRHGEGGGAKGHRRRDQPVRNRRRAEQ